MIELVGEGSFGKDIGTTQVYETGLCLLNLVKAKVTIYSVE